MGQAAKEFKRAAKSTTGPPATINRSRIEDRTRGRVKRLYIPVTVHVGEAEEDDEEGEEERREEAAPATGSITTAITHTSFQ